MAGGSHLRRARLRHRRNAGVRRAVAARARRAPGTAGARRPDPGAHVTTPLIKPLYTAKTTATGVRAGHAVSDAGILHHDLRPPKSIGRPGGTPNPQHLFPT